MKQKSYATRRSIQLVSFSSFLSSKRLQNIQLLLDKLSLDGIVTILGIDSRYNDGCRQLANYLLFGFYSYETHLIKESNVTEEELEDLIILIRKQSVAVYCCPSLYNLLLPYISHWRNLEIHCLSGDNQDDLDEDKQEEFKIKSFVAMVDGLSNIGIPYYTGSKVSISKQSAESFTPIVVEKWPLVQSYALEGVGRGEFFTMRFTVGDVHNELHSIYEECDPVNLELALSNSYSLLERHWQEVINVVSGTSSKKSPPALLSVSEADVAEPLRSYFNHGRLSSSHHSITDIASSAASLSLSEPFVCFGSRTNNIDDSFHSSPTVTLSSPDVDGHALHMIIHGSTPRKPFACTRTYFLDSPRDDAKQNIFLLINLYKGCMKACKKFIAEYCKSRNVAKTLELARKVLSKSCSAYCPAAKHHCEVEVFDNSGRRVAASDKNTFHMKKFQATISNIKDKRGNILGSVCYADTFIDSCVAVLDSDSRKIDSDHIVLTSSIPSFVQWTSKVDQLKCESPSLANLKNVFICSESRVIDDTSVCDVEVFEDGSIAVMSPHLPSFLLSIASIENCACYHTGLPNSVSILCINLKPSSHFPQVFQSKKESCFGIAVYPQSTAWKLLSTIVIPHFEGQPTFSSSCEVDGDLIESYTHVQAKYNWQAGLSHRTNNTLRSSTFVRTTASLQPRLADFLRHYCVSYVVDDAVLSEKDLSAALCREEEDVELSKSQNQKINVTVLCGLPGSHAERLCASIVTLHKERVRWVVVKVQCMEGEALLVDQAHLQKQLAELVTKRRGLRPGVAATKRLRIIIEAVGFFDVKDVVACVTAHADAASRDQMTLGAVTTCVNPLTCYVEQSRLFPNTLEQCAAGFANNIAFTGVLENVKDKNLACMQALVRNVNPDAAFLLVADGQVTRSMDFDLILNENSFECLEYRTARCLTRQLMSYEGSNDAASLVHREISPRLMEIKLDFSQPLLKGTFCARLRALRNHLVSFPFTGNIFAVRGALAFVDPNGKPQESDLSFVANTGALHIESRAQAGVTPAPPSSRGPAGVTPAPPSSRGPTGVTPAPPSSRGPVGVTPSPSSCRNPTTSRPYHLRFYGVGLSETQLRDWLRKSGRQPASKKCHKTRATMTSSEKKRIQEKHKQDSLPEGIFFNGSQYISLIDNSRSYEHPCMDRFIDEYLQVENTKIDGYNKKIETQNPPDLFA